MERCDRLRSFHSIINDKTAKVSAEMKILVIGSGGREHAIVWALQRGRGGSARPKLFCAPGNAGIAQLARCVSINATDIDALSAFAEQEMIDLTIVGSEAPLAAGVADEFGRRGLTVAGASSAAAQLESSKVFAKDFMTRHKIPTARYQVATSSAQALMILQSGEFGQKDSPVVVKADGLAAGKGVIVAQARAAAESAIIDLMERNILGTQAAHRVVIEEALVGREASLLLFADGRDFALMPAARDHKRIGEHDTGPNTGGMGAITDPSVIDQATLGRIIKEVIEPTLEGTCDEGFPFRGVLFIGLMLTAEGPRVLEYNVRFGDPEAQAILVRLQTDLIDIFEAVAHGRLKEVPIRWSEDASACVVLATRGYPMHPQIGAVIEGLNQVARDATAPHVQIFHAGTMRSDDGQWHTAGGRVLNVTATGETLERALRRCYEAVGKIHWDGMQFRRDIGNFNEAQKLKRENE
jgi:phosphoribosylamine--glycine ligase